jgi:RNA polymerase sigma-70 factor (ECF subfamily)
MNTNADGNSLFPLTRWSLVVSAAAGAELSLETLCRHYWQPVFAVARHTGHDIESAKDLTQGFFAKLLEKGWLGSADHEKGRFRTFLVTALKRYMTNEWHREHTARRGGRLQHVPLDTELTEHLEAQEDVSALPPDKLFDRQWALTLMARSLKRLENEWADGNFDLLKECLTSERGETDYAGLARHLGSSEGAARVAIHRLRKRYRELIRDEIASTVANPDDVEEELSTLLQSFV